MYLTSEPMSIFPDRDGHMYYRWVHKTPNGTYKSHFIIILWNENEFDHLDLFWKQWCLTWEMYSNAETFTDIC